MATAETPTGTLDAVPDSLKKTLQNLDTPIEQIRFAVRSDVRSNGKLR